MTKIPNNSQRRLQFKGTLNPKPSAQVAESGVRPLLPSVPKRESACCQQLAFLRGFKVHVGYRVYRAYSV